MEYTRCKCCGTIIPEGRTHCYQCSKLKYKYETAFAWRNYWKAKRKYEGIAEAYKDREDKQDKVEFYRDLLDAWTRIYNILRGIRE